MSDDFDDADNRSTLRPHKYLPNLPGTFTTTSPQSMQFHSRQPPSPASARMPYPSPADRRRQLDLNTGSAMQPSHSTPALGDTLAFPRRQFRRGSIAEEREKAPRDSERAMEPADSERSSRPLLSSSVDKAKTSRPAGVGSLPDEMIVREQEPTTTRKASIRLSPRRRGVPRTDTSVRKGKVAPSGSYITWKAADSVSGSSPSRSLRNTKSTEMLQNLPPPPPLRSTPSRPQLHVASNSATSFVRPPEPPSGLASRPHRPLPPTQGPALDNATVEASAPIRSFPQPQSSPSASANPATYLSPSQEPYPRPHSASPAQQRFPGSSDALGYDTLRDRDVQRPLPSLHHQSHSAGNSVSKFGDTPFREDGFSGNALPLSLRAGPYSSSVRPPLTSDTPPRSPISTATSRPSTSTSSSTFAYMSSGSMMDARQNSSSSGQDTLSESTLRPGEGDKVIWDFKARVASQKLSQQPDTPVDSISSDDDYATATNDLWSRRPLSQIVRGDMLGPNTSPKSSPRPALEVITHSTNNNLRGVPSNLAVADYVPQLQPQPRLRDLRPRTPRDGHKSTFEEYTWAHRPPPEDVYDRLEEFFPEHDLDKPVIEANSGGTSPTAVDPSHAITSNDRERINNVRGKKSIRIVAEEHKKRLDRTSRAESAYGNLLRRSTKLWGGHVEEVTTSQKKPTISKPTVDASSGGPRRG